MLDNKRILPWSGKRYTITGIGEVITSDGEILEPIKRNNELFVKLNWVLGYQEYLIAILVLVTYDMLKIPDYLLDEIVPLYIDNSSSNLAPVNLLYRFKSGKLEVENYPGFYYIPFYVDYAINTNGDLINISTGKYKTWSITKPNLVKNQTGGYRYSRVINDLGFSKCLFQHRALCYVFKDYESDVMKLIVNHKDGNPANNYIDNLELVTYQRNNIHAVEIGLRGDNKPVVSKNLLTGEILKFSSILACGRHYEQPQAGFIQHRLRCGAGVVYPDKLQFKFDDGTPWPPVNINNIQRIGKSVDIQARNVFTGEKIIFQGCPTGEKLIGVKASTILSHVRDSKIIPVDGWNFRWFEENIIWPEHNEKLLKVFSKFPIYPPDGAIAYNVDKDEELFFESVSLVCQHFKITKHLFFYHARNKKLFLGKFRFELFRLREHLGLPAEKSV